jgi:hypothetical protein
MSPRKRRKSVPFEGSRDAPGLDVMGSAESEANPWQDAHSRVLRSQGSQNQQTSHHRLSFDPGSGVIMLPENGGWLDEESDSSDELLDPDNDGRLGISARDDELSLPPEDGGSSSNLMEGSAVASPAKRRYATYYHHPERRRQTIPGAFPR